MKPFQKLTLTDAQRPASITLGIIPETIDLGNNWKTIFEESWDSFSLEEKKNERHHFNPFAYKNLKALITAMNEYLGTDYPWYTYGREWCFIKPSYYLTVLGLPLESLAEQFDWNVFVENASVDHIFGNPNNFHHDTTWLISRVIPEKKYGFVDPEEGRIQQAFYGMNDATKGALHAPIEKVVSIKDVNPYTTREKVVLTTTHTSIAIDEGSLSTKILSGKVPSGAVLISAPQ